MAILAVGTDVGNLHEISLDPSKLTWGEQDISTEDAGRDQQGEMHKNTVARKVRLEVEWVMPTMAQSSEILQAFDPEYVYLRYPDPKRGGLVIKRFYMGDRSAPFKWVDVMDGTRVATISFPLIEK